MAVVRRITHAVVWLAWSSVLLSDHAATQQPPTLIENPLDHVQHLLVWISQPSLTTLFNNCNHVMLWTLASMLTMLTPIPALYFPVLGPEKAAEELKLKQNLRGKEAYLAVRVALLVLRMGVLIGGAWLWRHDILTAAVGFALLVDVAVGRGIGRYFLGSCDNYFYSAIHSVSLGPVATSILRQGHAS